MLVSSDKSTQILLQQDNLREEVINALNELINSQQNESKELVVSLQDSVKQKSKYFKHLDFFDFKMGW